MKSESINFIKNLEVLIDIVSSFIKSYFVFILIFIYLTNASIYATKASIVYISGLFKSTYPYK